MPGEDEHVDRGFGVVVVDDDEGGVVVDDVGGGLCFGGDDVRTERVATDERSFEGVGVCVFVLPRVAAGVADTSLLGSSLR